MNTSRNNSDFSLGIEFRLNNSAVRYSWAAYQLFVFLSSLIGDSLILNASFQKEALKVNKFVLTVIQHIAVSNLATSVFHVLPAVVTLLANSWVLGHDLCYVKVYFAWHLFPANMLLIAVLTTSKFLILRYPLRITSWSTQRAHQVCSFSWAFSLILPIVNFVVDKNDVHFYYRSYQCSYGFDAEIWRKLLPITSFIFNFVPNVVIISTTIPTLKYLTAARKAARRVKGSVPWQGALAVALTAAVYCISTLPYAAYRISQRFIKGDHWFQVTLYRIVTATLLLNVASNIYIYALTLKSFRRFLFTKVLLVLPVFSHTSTSRNSASTAAGEEKDGAEADKDTQKTKETSINEKINTS